MKMNITFVVFVVLCLVANQIGGAEAEEEDSLLQAMARRRKLKLIIPHDQMTT